MPTKDGFTPDHPLPVFLSEYAEEFEQPDMGKAWDGAAIASRILKMSVLAVAAMAIAVLWLIFVWIRWQSTSYTLTDQRIKIETGVFSRQSKMIPIDRVQDCTTRMSVLGRMLGYGRVEVDGDGRMTGRIAGIATRFLPGRRPMIDRMISAGHLGRKTARGFYANYDASVFGV